MQINLHDYDLIVINTSGGKDSTAAIWEISRMAARQGYSRGRIHLSHQILKRVEWPGTMALVRQHAKFFGMELHTSKQRNAYGEELSLLDYALQRGKWPSAQQRWCTSDFKRGPGARVVRMLSRRFNARRILHVFGFRAEESPSRAKRPVLQVNTQLRCNGREVHDYLPIHDWTVDEVWDTIKTHNIPYHHAYRLGMPRLSCAFCIFAPKDALVIAGIHNPQLLEEYIAVEKQINYSFKNGFWISEVKELIDSGYVPKKIDDWKM